MLDCPPVAYTPYVLGVRRTPCKNLKYYPSDFKKQCL